MFAFAPIIRTNEHGANQCQRGKKTFTLPNDRHYAIFTVSIVFSISDVSLSI